MSSSPYPSRSADGGAPEEPGAPSFTYPSRPVVLVIDDEAGVRESLRIILQDDFEVLEAADGAAALEIVRSRRIDVALLDVRMPGEPGPAVLPRILALSESIAVILMTAVPQVRTAVDAIKAGAYDYVIKPFEPDEILLLVRQAAQHRLLEREVRYLRSEFDRAHGFDALVGRHARMARLYELIAQVAPTHVTVLITAESGTGKELVARAIHRQSLRARPAVRRREPRGDPRHPARIGAVRPREGRLHGRPREEGRGSSSWPTAAHCSSTRWGACASTSRPSSSARLQEREVERLGGVRTTPVDVRVIAATNIDLKQAVRARTFREDLFYRLNVVPLSVPPLRDRKEDIALLVDHFVKKYSREFKKDVRGVSQGALPALEAYDWPGNVRELENVIERSVALATRPVILLEDLPLDLAMHEPRARRRRAIVAVAQGGARAVRAGLCAAGARARGLEPEPHGPASSASTAIPSSPGSPPGASGRRAEASSGRGWWGSRRRARRRRKESSPEGTGWLGAGRMAPGHGRRRARRL